MNKRGLYNIYKVKNVIFLAVFLLANTVGLSILFSCDSRPSHRTEQAWQKNFPEALIEGYTNFKGHYVNADTTVYIFSYRLPPKLKTKEAFATFRRQIINYTLTSESPTELVLRRSIPDFTPGGFHEYRFLINEQQEKVTVMFAGLDTEAKIKFHQSYIEILYEEHRKYLSNIM